MTGSTIVQVVTVDDRYDGVAEPHRSNGVRQMPWLMRVGRCRLAKCLDRTETAAPGALLAGYHEGRRATSPAFVDVGAACLFADGVQRIVRDGAGGRAIACHRLTGRQLDAEPFGQPRSCARGQGAGISRAVKCYPCFCGRLSGNGLQSSSTATIVTHASVTGMKSSDSANCRCAQTLTSMATEVRPTLRVVVK